MEGGTAKQIARWVALGALFLIPLAPLIVANSFFFPFITGKAFYVRILVEVAFCAWAALALMDRAYRPRLSWAGAAVVAFVAWMFVADCFAVNAQKAFWSNFERMEGWVLLIHLLMFFFAASAVLRVERKWRAWFLASLAVSVIVALHAVLQLVDPSVFPIHQGSTRIDSSLGNSAYLAIYFLFNTFLALWLAATTKRPWLRWSLLALAVFEGALIFFTETRGTVLGLTGALLLAALLTALTAGKRLRAAAIGALALIIVVAGGAWLARDSAFVQGNHILQRITSISLADGATRFTIWHLAWEGFLERPITGWGQEGFNYVFNKFYDPSLYQQEPWFDRAHNAFIDWLSAGGAPGFMLYVALFAAGLWCLWRAPGLRRRERILLTAALAGYACHNLFVFDNLYSYIYFFAILAFIDARAGRPSAAIDGVPVLSEPDSLAYALPGALVAALALVWFVNVPGMRAASELIIAISPSPEGPSANIAAFQDLVKHPAFAAQEVREQLVSFAASLAESSSATAEEKTQALTLAIAQAQAQVTAHPQDARAQLQLSYAYDAAGDAKDALAATLDAGALSPGKETIWLQAGEFSWDLGDAQGAHDYFNKAYALGPEFQDLAAYAAAGDLAVGDKSGADALLLNAYGTTTVDSDVLAVAYYRTKDWTDLIALWQYRAASSPADPQTLLSLAAAYYTAGQKGNAIATLNQVSARFPEASTTAQAAIQQIESGVPLAQ